MPFAVKVLMLNFNEQIDSDVYKFVLTLVKQSFSFIYLSRVQLPSALSPASTGSRPLTQDFYMRYIAFSSSVFFACLHCEMEQKPLSSHIMFVPWCARTICSEPITAFRSTI